MNDLNVLLQRYLQGETIRNRSEVYPNAPTPISRLLIALVETVVVLQYKVKELQDGSNSDHSP